MIKKYPIIDFNNVHIIKNDRKILDSVSFCLEQGSHLAIVGPNGSGKSTLIKTIIREYYPVDLGTGPAVKLFGESSWDLFELRNMLGIVSNNLQEEFTRDMTVNEVILSGFFSSVGLFTNHHVTHKMNAKAVEILSFLEIDHLAGSMMNEISTGEARRALIGRALIHDPKALILDEPMNALDMHAVYNFREIIRKIARSGKSIVMVTHNLSDIIPEIDRVILLKNGKIFFDGEKKKALTRENLAKLFMVPLNITESNGYYNAVLE